MKYFFVILLFFLLPIVVFAQRLPTLEDEQYKTACGPIACRVALEALGIETTLDEIAKRCSWEQDKYLPLENLQNALKSYHGINCQIAKLSPKELCQLLKDDQTVVILALRKNTDEIDHAVCAVSVQENDQVIKLIDYPELTQRKLVAELADAWDGAALVVRITPFYRACGDFAVCFAPMVIVIMIVLWFRRRNDKKASSPNIPT
jgi:ABC-type bacteriocin/lantibiotic exporter with double-glycine peptidase domain